VAVLL